MAKTNWKKFPHPDKAFDYTGPALKKNLGELRDLRNRVASERARRDFSVGDI